MIEAMSSEVRAEFGKRIPGPGRTSHAATQRQRSSRRSLAMRSATYGALLSFWIMA
jgi:hypothetical protein